MLAHSHPLVKTECLGRQWASSCNGKRPNVVNLVGRLLSSCLFAFDSDDDGFSCSNTVAKWNLSLSQSHEYHHPDHEWERWKQIVASSFCRGANYLVMEMNFCVGLSSSWKKAYLMCNFLVMSTQWAECAMSTPWALGNCSFGML
jgi:hypothetical protein